MRKFFILCLVTILVGATLFYGCGEGDSAQSPLLEDVPIEYTVDINLSDNNVVECSVDIKHQSCITAENIIMQCYSLAYEEAVVEYDMIESCYPSGVNFGKTTIKSITVNGTKCNYNIGYDSQYIDILYPIKYGETVTIQIDYDIKLANLKHRLGYYDGYYTLSGFYPYVCPVIDQKYSVRGYSRIGEVELLHVSNFNVTLNIPKGNVVVNSGEILDKTTDGDRVIYKMEALNVRDFAIVWSKNFSLRSATNEGITFNYYYNNDATPLSELNLIQKVVATFGELFGEYNHKTLSVVLTPFSYAGMEYSQLVLINKELKEDDRKEVIIHEIAHQWWYLKVGSDQAYSPWLDESLAEFSVAIYYLKNDEGMKFESIRRYGLKTLESRLIKTKNTNIKGSIYEFDGESYSECVYTIGCLMWINYYCIKGPEVLDDLKEYANVFDSKIATEEDIRRMVFKNYSALLEGWLSGNVLV